MSDAFDAFKLALDKQVLRNLARTIRAKVKDARKSPHDAGATFIKFQPVFDDGYLGANAPVLRLCASHATVVRPCGVVEVREVREVRRGHRPRGCGQAVADQLHHLVLDVKLRRAP